jgi:adenylate cyclase
MRLRRCPDLDTLVGAVVDGLAQLFGYEHSALLLLDEQGDRLYTIASHGYDTQGIGSEVVVGEGIIGVAAAKASSVRVGNLRQMRRYGASVRRSFEDHGGVGPGREIPLPGLPGATSQLAVPAVALGEMIGVLMVESVEPVAFDAGDEAVLTVTASLAAAAIELERTRAGADDSTAGSAAAGRLGAADAATPTTHVRFYSVDGSTFLDGDYLIKGVLWSLLRCTEETGRMEFSNREVRLDPSLELPEVRDNFESRLILLKRRLDERDAPVRIEKTGRGRFRLVIDTALRLEAISP